jgi:hypothetical protein
MLFTYNRNRIAFISIKLHQYLLFLILPILLLITIVYFTGYKLGFDKNLSELSMEERVLLVEELDPFSEVKLIDMMKDLGIKFPHIVLAQSKLETGSWKSSLFLENHNLFGMKRASRRVSTAKGSNNGHAYYDNWRESVYDYAFYQCRYLGNIKTEKEYYSYLSSSYAEDTTYVGKLKDIINKEQYKSKFN